MPNGTLSLPDLSWVPATAEACGKAATTVVSVPSTSIASDEEKLRQSRVDALVSAYRRVGHHQAKLDPLNLMKRTAPELTLEYVKLTEADLDSEFEIYWRDVSRR